MELVAALLARCQALQKGVRRRTSNAFEHPGGKDKVKHRPWCVDEVIMRNYVISTDLCNLGVHTLDVRTINHTPALKQVGCR